MDYIDIFKNLKTNNKWGRKSPHKAVLMLTVIELYEKNILTENIIHYDETLKSTFLHVWNRVLPNEPLFHPEAYLPFWYLQSDSFWHIVPIRGQEDILSLMRDSNTKPSEAKIYDSVKYAELDENLYFLMTLPSGRSSLKRTLLETYTTLPKDQIDKLAESVDNSVDYSLTAMDEYEQILSSAQSNEKRLDNGNTNEQVSQFKKLNDNLQIALNYEYYSFLKTHRSERDLFREICPDVFALYEHIINNPLRQIDISPSFAFIYDNFLCDLKIALMSENGSMELIEKIDAAIAILRGNDVAGDTPTTEEKIEFSEIKKEKDFKGSDLELSKELHFQETDHQTIQNYSIKNNDNHCYIINNYGERVFSSSGKLKNINEEFYRVNYTYTFISMDLIKKDEKGVYVLGKRILNASYRSPLYAALDEKVYLDQIIAVRYDQNTEEYHVQVDDRWYGSSGYYADLVQKENSDERAIEATDNNEDDYSDKTNLTIDNSEIEHVYLDNRGKISKIVSPSPKDTAPMDNPIESRKGKAWTQEEEERITLYFERGISTVDIAERVGRTEVAIKSRLAKLGLIEYTYGQENPDKTTSNGMTDTSLTNPYAQVSYDSPNIFVPKGKMKRINEIAEESYDFLLTMAVVEFMKFIPQPTIITFDRLASMMIALAWEILNENKDVKVKEGLLNDCIEFLIAESKEEMDEVLTWSSSRKTVFNAIKDYPMADVYEDAVDALIAKAPYNVLRAWFCETDEEGIVSSSNLPSASCLYAIHPMKNNPYIDIKQGWKGYLLKENEKLMNYYKRLYLEFLEEC